jgi:hypothetical protein
MKQETEIRIVRELLAGAERGRPGGEEARLVEVWDALDLSEPEPAPPAFAPRVLARAAAEARRAPWLPLAPGWARAAAALLLAAGIAGGFGIGRAAALEPEADPLAAWTEATFAEAYLAADGEIGGEAR